jgi:hypothetical protein
MKVKSDRFRLTFNNNNIINVLNDLTCKCPCEHVTILTLASTFHLSTKGITVMIAPVYKTLRIRLSCLIGRPSQYL